MFALVKPDGLEQPYPAPASDHFWPSAEPSTSSAIPANPTTATTNDQTDKDLAGDDGPAEAAAVPNDGDSDSSVDACDPDSKDAFCDILTSYMCKRNIVIADVCDTNQIEKAVIEFLNLKFVENNFRSIGLNSKKFDKNNITEAQLEFDLFDKWLTRKKKLVNGNKYVKDLRLPMFCHLYLSLYLEKNRDCLLTFLDLFKHLFTSSKGVIFLQELKNVTNINNLSSRLTIFRKNKYVCSLSPKFVISLYGFFQQHYMLKMVFQEWFDITYFSDEDPMVVFNNYCSKSMSRRVSPNQNSDKLEKTAGDNNDNLNSEMLNNKERQQTIKKKSKFDNRQKSSDIETSGSSENSSEDYLEDSSSEHSFSDEETVMRKYIKNQKKSVKKCSRKTSCHLKLSLVSKIDVKTLDEDLYLCTLRQITLNNCSKLSCTILTSDHKYVAAGSLNSLIYLWERSNIPTELEKNRNLNIIPSAKSNSFIECLDRSTAKILRGHGGSIFDLAEISSVNILLSASSDKTFRVWDLVSKICLEVYNEHEHRTWCISACPNSLKVATGSCDGVSCLWFLNYKSPLRFYVGHLDDVLVIKFHPNQVLLATGSADKTIRLFELITGACQRLLLGHSDYITCLEFHARKPNILASACGAGELIVWDMPSGEILWKLNVGKVSFSDIAWLTDDIMLASLTTGVVLKCDITENYKNTTKKVKGFTTKFNRLMSLKVVDSIVYTIGLPGKPTVPKPSSMSSKAKATLSENKLLLQQESKSSKNASPIYKFLLPQQIVQSNINSMKTKLSLKSELMKSPLFDLEYQLTIDPNDTSLLTPDILQMDLQHPLIDLTSDESTMLNTDYQPNNILTQKLSSESKNSMQNISSTIQITDQISNLNSSISDFHSTDINLSESLTSVLQNECNKLSINSNFQLLQLPDCEEPMDQPTDMTMDIFDQNQLQQLFDFGDIDLEPNLLVQQQQQPQLETAILPQLNTQIIQNDLVQQDQHLQVQTRVGNNMHITSANVSQQPLFQHLQPNTLMTKINVQQRQSQQQIGVRLTNANASQSQTSDLNAQHVSKPSVSSIPSVPIRVAIRQQKPQLSTTQSPTLEKMPAEDYAKLRQAVMTSLLQSNPELFSRGQPVIGEITRSQSVAQSMDVSKSNSQTELQPSKNTHK